jgi:putative Holliday junction resolvase
LTAETLLGFDYGARRIGVAVGQTLTGTASALATVACDNSRPHWEAIGALIAEWRPQRLIVGLPRHLDGREHELKPVVERFARQLEGRFGLPVTLVDERLTSAEASARLVETRQKGRRRKIRKDEIDRLSAAILLETWMSGGT